MNDTLDELWVPRAAARCRLLPLRQLASHVAQAHAAFLELTQRRRERSGSILRFSAVARSKYGTMGPEPYAPRFSCCQRCLCPLGDQPRFKLGNLCHDANHKLAHRTGDLRHISEQDLDAAVEEGEEETSVP